MLHMYHYLAQTEGVTCFHVVPGKLTDQQLLHFVLDDENYVSTHSCLFFSQICNQHPKNSYIPKLSILEVTPN